MEKKILPRIFVSRAPFLCKVLMLCAFYLSSFALSANGSTQGVKLSLNLRNVSVNEALTHIEKNSDYVFFYSDAVKPELEKKTNVNFDSEAIEEVLNTILEPTALTYSINEKQVSILLNEKVEKAAQDDKKTIRGTVADNTGEPLVGVSVTAKGTTSGTVTDMDGKYSISVSEGISALIFSYIGYNPITESIGNKSVINIVLSEDEQILSEIVVVGFGTQKKENLTGAVAVVKGEDMAKRPVVNAAAMLQAQVPGLRVNQGSGEPGANGVSLRVRGQGTYSGAGSDPLVLINGVPGSMTNLDPNSIESVSVLKDAASAAVYGARAANGVILITTKTGTNQPTTISYSGNLQISQPTRMIDLVTNSVEYMELFNKAKKNSGQSGTYDQKTIDLYRNAPAGSLEYPSYDWINGSIGTALSHTHNLAVSGGSDKMSYNVMLNYADEEGTMKGFDAQKYNVTLDLQSQVTKWLKFGTFASLKRGDRSALRLGSGDAFLSLASQAPTYRPQREDGKWVKKAYSHEQSNKNIPGLLANDVLKKTTDYDANAQAWLEVDLLKGLSWHTKGAARYTSDKAKDWRPVVQTYLYHTGEEFGILDVGGKGLEVQDTQRFYTYLSSYLKYELSLANKAHNFGLQFGYSQESDKFENLRGYRRDYDFVLTELNAGSSSLQESSGYTEEWALQGVFGRFNYNFKERYLFEANFRYDGTSRIISSKRWGLFPSFSAAWRATEESFVKNLNLSWLDNFKIRGSWGQLGNQNIGIYPYQDRIESANSYPYDNASITNGYAQITYYNKNLKWETTTVTDFGLDMTVLKGVSVTFDWYSKKTTDILRTAQVTSLLGLGAPTINDGKMTNTGIELNIQYNNYIKAGTFKGLSYSAGIYFDRVRNKLAGFGQQEIDGQNIRREGLPYNTFYMMDCIGVFADENEIKNSPKQFNDDTKPGDLKYRDVNGDKIIDINDRAEMKGRFPSFEYAFNGSVSWKGVDISALMSGVEGIKYYVTDWGIQPFRQGSAPTKDYVKGMWTEENPNNVKHPRMYFDNMGGGKNTRHNSYFLKDASYLRLKNLTVGYTFPDRLMKNSGIRQLRVFFSGDNLFTITDYPELDPERGGDGRFLTYPQNKVYAFGLNIQF